MNEIWRRMCRGCVGVAVCLLMGCESEYEHFCSKYAYFYKELSKPGVLSITELRAQLQREAKGSGADRQRARMGLFVLKDVETGLKPLDETPKDYCMRRKRWERFH